MCSTSRHLMRPLTAEGRVECLELKSKLLDSVQAGEFVVEAFARAASDFSVDEETRARGGLLGTRLRQGTVRSRALDRACFTSTLGKIQGPIESEFGWHLVLVEERIGCRFDKGMTQVVPQVVGDGSPGERPFVRSALAPPSAADERQVWVGFAQALSATIALWLGANMLGGAFARSAADAANQLLGS
jgi:hypothetical protein